ncbi:hypothetical protein AVEN_204222-1 [Araneus ventricosus]|uniref:Uncharacterized protein n=1 Tax=Araneus ventricosus TaxID=182803 RepID=A0A4Y2I7E1_ARAVE|nr:hypothetical protein AVEN_204222-1 [Araneus ventricosus]
MDIVISNNDQMTMMTLEHQSSSTKPVICDLSTPHNPSTTSHSDLQLVSSPISLKSLSLHHYNPLLRHNSPNGVTDIGKNSISNLPPTTFQF